MNELQNIQDYIYVIREQRVMLDRDIAAFYGVETKRLNEKVKRNHKRFAGDDFMFQLTKEELEELRSRSQFATMKKGRGSNFKFQISSLRFHSFRSLNAKQCVGVGHRD